MYPYHPAVGHSRHFQSFLLSMILALLWALVFPQTLPAQPSQGAVAHKNKELRILTTIFPVYIFTKNVTASRPYVRVELMVPSRTGCPHSYAPSPQDLKKLSSAHALVINGLGLENFLGQHLNDLPSNISLIDCSRGITPLPQTGIPTGHEHCEHHHGHANPHIFAGPQQAASMVYNIAVALAELDPQGATAYKKAAEQYMARLYSLARRLHSMGQTASHKGIVLQHDALAYLAHNAGLEITAVVQSGDDQAPSAARLLELTRQIQTQKPVLIATEPQFPDRMAQVLGRETHLPVISLDPLVSGPIDAPLSHYETVMAANCNLLEQYFGKP